MINPLSAPLPIPDFTDPYFKYCVKGVVSPERVKEIQGVPARMQSLEQAWNIAMPRPIPRFPRWLVLDTPERASNKIKKFLINNPSSGVRFDITTSRDYHKPEYHRFFVHRGGRRNSKEVCQYVSSGSEKGVLPGMKVGGEYDLDRVLDQARSVEIMYYHHDPEECR